MPWPVHPNGLLGAQGDNDTYQISRSLRFNAGDSTHLNRTLSSPTNNIKWTFSWWMKKTTNGLTTGGGTGDCGILITANGVNSDALGFSNGDDVLRFIINSATVAAWSPVYRDTSSWYHFVLVYDSANATQSDRLILYQNGSRITSLSTAVSLTPSQSVKINSAQAHYIGPGTIAITRFFDGYLTEINFIDGQALTPSSFGETDAVTGRWKAKAYSGSYGTNGFYLKFADNSSTAALGTDSSGNGNTWDVNNFSVTAGAGNDSLVDSPTNYGSDSGVGGEVRGNYCTLNALRYGSGSTATMSDGNLYFANSGNAGTAIGTFAIPSTGKWYWEAVVPTQTYNFAMVGVVKDQQVLSNLNTALGILSTGYAVYSSDGQKYNNNVASSYMGANNQNTVMTIAYNADTGSLYVGAGGVWANGSGATNQTFANAVAAYTGLTGTIHPAISVDTGHCYINFGQRPFAYTAPTGFKALCTTNLSTPTIKKPSTAMDVVTYTGTGASNSISSLGFSPDLVWLKNRGTTTSHALYDTVRGVQAQLSSDTTGTEVTSSTGLTTFGSNGFTIGTSSLVNTSGTQYVAWAWDEAPIAGMDIVDYTGDNNSSRTISHTLGVVPSMIILKPRSGSYGTEGWQVWHKSLSASNVLQLHSTAAQAGTGTFTSGIISSSPTANVFGFTAGGGGVLNVNASSTTYIAYLFSEVEGFSKFDSYTGNGSADGPFVYCGFRPRWVMIKRTDAGAGDWVIFDTARIGYNVDNNPLYPNLSGGEPTTDILDILSNGFKLRATGSGENGSGATYIFAAFAEAPFKYARAR